jgi:hypothetical protein
MRKALFAGLLVASTLAFGTVMEARDGSKLMMKNNAIWKQITEHGTLKPGH